MTTIEEPVTPAGERDEQASDGHLTQEQAAEIEAARSDFASTLRVTVPDLEEMLYRVLPVLDHGFVRVVDYMGDDAAVVQAARVSYGKGTKTSRTDQGLINYLLRNWHTTPFEMCEIKLHVKLPIFVARQWIRHRTANVNEYSARYSILDREFYIPAADQLATQSTTNRQGRGEAVSHEQAVAVQELLRADSNRAYEHYERLLNETAGGEVLDQSSMGIARELARIGLSLNYYTQWYWKTDLHNLMHFLRLRSDAHAQYEIRAYAEVIANEIFARWVPKTYAAFCDYRQGGLQLSEKGLQIVRQLLAGEPVDRQEIGMSPAEWRELMADLGREP